MSCLNCEFNCTCGWQLKYDRRMRDRIAYENFYNNHPLKVTYFVDERGTKIPTIGAVASFEPVIAVMTQKEFDNGGKEKLQKRINEK